MNGDDGKPSKRADARQERLAEALRANLRRRKSQSRQRNRKPEDDDRRGSIDEAGSGRK